MKRTGLLMVAILLTGLTTFAQRTAADDLFDQYAGKDGYTTVYISKGLFHMVSQLQEDDKDAQELINGLESIKILSSDTVHPGVNFYKEINDKLPADKYEELMVVKSNDQNVRFLVQKDGDMIHELLLIVGGSDDNVLIIIRGNLTLKAMAKLAGNMKIHGNEFDWLSELENI